jgi:maltose O-acetyltransferase
MIGQLKRLLKRTGPYRFFSWLYGKYREDQERVYRPSDFREFGKDVQIGRNVFINRPDRVVLKDRCAIQSGTIINSYGGLYVGENTGVGYYCVIFTGVHRYRKAKSIPFDSVAELKPVIIREFVWIGSHVKILPGIEIGEGAIIGMGAVITKNVPPLAIVLGNPAEIVGYRSKEHYYKCKEEKAYESISVMHKRVEMIPAMIRARYPNELKELGLIQSAPAHLGPESELGQLHAQGRSSGEGTRRKGRTIIAAVIAGGVIMLSFVARRELPFRFDVVQLQHGLAIINQDTWNQRPLFVKVVKDGRQLAVGTIDPETHSEVLKSNAMTGDVAMEISRSDLVGRLRYKTKTIRVNASGQEQSYIVLVGASIGRDWNLADFPARVGDSRYVFGTRVHYDFDKSAAIAPLLKLKLKPKAVIIKECSVYFPRDLQQSTRILEGWVELLKEANIVPILATTTPVAASGPVKTKQGAIDAWNEHIRNYAREQGVALFDLARALQASEADTHMKTGYSQEDGYHLTASAYSQALDPLLKEFVARHFSM